MRIAATSVTLARTYEALRAAALGLPVSGTPRGLAILRGAGMTAWMAACPPDRAAVRERSLRLVGAPSTDRALGRELAGILADMALAARTCVEVAP